VQADLSSAWFKTVKTAIDSTPALRAIICLHGKGGLGAAGMGSGLKGKALALGLAFAVEARPPERLDNYLVLCCLLLSAICGPLLQ
jgi:hypothetical protein